MRSSFHVDRAYRIGASFVLAAAISMSLAAPAQAQTIQMEWTRQFGGAQIDAGKELAVGPEGSVYIAGDTDGLPGEPHAGGVDGFLRKYSASGTLLWSRTFGTVGDEIVGLNATGLAIGPDALYVAGFTTGSFPGFTNAGGLDAFLRKYDFLGNQIWTIQFGTDGFDDLHDVAVDKDKAIYVAGSTDRALPGQTWAGDFDAVLRKYNPDGTIAWTRQVGTSGFDHPVGMTFDSTGVYLVGNTSGAWPGFTSAGLLDALVLRFTRDGVMEWARQFGTAQNDLATRVTADQGGVYVVGGVNGALPGQAFAGVRDVFVRKFNPGGEEKWTTQFGAAGIDVAFGAFAIGGSLLISGRVSAALPGQTYSGGPADAFVRRYDGKSGAVLWTHQFGTAGFDIGGDIVPASTRTFYLSGLTDRALPGQTHAGNVDTFVMKLVLTD